VVEPVHLLILHQNFVDHRHPGGTRHLELAKNLVEMGHRVTVVTGTLDYLTGKPIEGPRRERISGVEVVRSYAFPSLHYSLIWRVVSYVSFMLTSIWSAIRIREVDVVLGTTPPLFQLPSAWLVARLKRRPFVLEVRDLWPEFAIDMGVLTNPIIIFSARRAEQFFYRRADHFVVNSPAYREYLVGKGVPLKTISVIPNGVDIRMFDPDSRGQQIRDELGLGDDFVVTYAGAMGPANDIETILDAAMRFDRAAHVRFVLVGGGRDAISLERKARARGLDHVVFAGTYPKDRMRCVLAASNACVATLMNIPMFKTTYPNKVFDYMAAGRPTILGIDGVIRDVIEQSEGGLFVTPGDSEALAQAIETMRSDPDLAQRMGRSARRYVEEHFDRRLQSTELEKVLKLVAPKAA